MISITVFRTLVITLAVLPARNHVKGFGINRGPLLSLEADEMSQESSILLTKADLQRPNDIRNEATNDETVTEMTGTTNQDHKVSIMFVALTTNLDENSTNSQAQTLANELSNRTFIAKNVIGLSTNLFNKDKLTEDDLKKEATNLMNAILTNPAITTVAESTSTDSVINFKQSSVADILFTKESIEKEADNGESTKKIAATTDQIANDSETLSYVTTDMNEVTQSDTTTFKTDQTSTQTLSPVGESTSDHTAEFIDLSTVTEPTTILFTETKDIRDTRHHEMNKYVTIDRNKTSSPEEMSINPDEISTMPMTKNSVLRQDMTNSHSTTNEIVSQSNQDISEGLNKQRSTPTDTTDRSISTLETKRGGFLDVYTYTEISETKITSTESTVTQDLKHTELLTTPDKMTTLPGGEAFTNDHIRSNTRYDIFKDDIPDIRNFDSTSVRDDNLSVQPLSQERKTTLYTISSNYKPMKKIDVQPPRSYMRDPDDNSWRNESISSLGIVFKPKNASKSFKEVLKNKTETEFSNILDKDSRVELPDLRLRLEKIAEERKTKKNLGKSGETNDYDETSSEAATTSMRATTEPMVTSTAPPLITVSQTSTPPEETNHKKKFGDFLKDFGADFTTSSKPKKYFDAAEYYESTDEYDADYVTLPSIDLKKKEVLGPWSGRKSTKIYMWQLPRTTTPEPITTEPPIALTTPPMWQTQGTRPTNPTLSHFMKLALPNRKATLQYFPPRKFSTQMTSTKPSVNIEDYDGDFVSKVNMFTVDAPVLVTTPSPVATDVPPVTKELPHLYTGLRKETMNTGQPPISDADFVINGEDYSRASYVIKHYKDVLGDAAKELDYDLKEDLAPMTVGPPQDPGKKSMDTELEEYDSRYHREVVSRFVDNFNQNSETFMVDFPVIYNNSVVHRKYEGAGREGASSSTMMKRVYPEGLSRSDHMSVELSPAYELHYYVPDQEEREEPDPRITNKS